MRIRRTQNLLAAALIGALALATMVPHIAIAEQDASAQGRQEAIASGGGTADQQAELAKQLQNPVAKLISVPLQSNWDWGIGPANAIRYSGAQARRRSF